MEKGAIETELTRIIRGILARSDLVLSADTKAIDIPDWNSLNHLRIILACEERFGVRLNARVVDSLNTVGNIIEVLAEKIDRKTRS